MKDYLNYKDKICVIAGPATGMGRACMERLIDLGGIIYALDVAPVDEPGVTYIEMDMGSRESIDAAMEKLPEKIDKFFGFSGVSGERHTARQVIEINFLGYKYIMEEHLSHRMAKGGAVVNITSVGGNLWNTPSNLEEMDPLVLAPDWDTAQKVLDVICEDLPVGQAYTFSKRCQTYITMKFALDMMEKEVRVNAVKPGNGLTRLTEQFMARFLRLNPGKTEEDYHKWCGHPTLGGAKPYQLAEPAIFLNSDMASYVSGEELRVDYTRTSDYKFLSGGNEYWTQNKLVHHYHPEENA